MSYAAPRIVMTRVQRVCLALILAVTACLAAAQIAAAQTHVVTPTNDGFLALRTGPGTGFDMIRRMPTNTALVELERSGNWSRFRVAGEDIVGWSHRGYTDEIMARRIIADPTGDGWLNLRTGPSTDYRVLGRLYNGAGVMELERSGNWSLVTTWDRYRGWLYRPYTKLQ